MVFHGALHRLYTVDRGDVTPIYPTPYQRLIGPSQGGAVKSMGNFEAQTLLDTQKNISISKKKINWSNNYSLWHLHLNLTFSLNSILQQNKRNLM
jgi:predicted transcriptional regulator